MKKLIASLRKRGGPVGLSLVAAALTAVAFAAVSVAQDGNGNDGKDEGAAREGDVLRGPGPGGPHIIQRELSEEDREALERFRSCMEENGAPAPPEPPKLGGDGEMPAPPEPPSAEEREAIERALEKCEAELPEGMPGPAFHHCGPPPGDGEGGEPGEPRREGSGEGAVWVLPAPQGATS